MIVSSNCVQVVLLCEIGQTSQGRWPGLCVGWMGEGGRGSELLTLSPRTCCAAGQRAGLPSTGWVTSLLRQPVSFPTTFQSFDPAAEVQAALTSDRLPARASQRPLQPQTFPGWPETLLRAMGISVNPCSFSRRSLGPLAAPAAPLIALPSSLPTCRQRTLSSCHLALEVVIWSCAGAPPGRAAWSSGSGPALHPPRQSAQTLWRDCQRSAGYRIWRPPSQLVGALATSGDTSASLQHCSSWQRACRTSGSMRAPQFQPPRQEQAPPPRSSRQQPGGSPLGWRPCQASQKRWTALHWRQV